MCPEDDEQEFEEDWDLEESCGYADGQIQDEGEHEVDTVEPCMR